MQWNGMECMWNRNQNKQEHPIQTQSFGFSDMDLPIFYTKFLKHVPYTPYNVTGLIKVCALLRLIRRKLESDVLSLTPTKPYGVFFHQLNSSKPPTTHPPGGPSGFMTSHDFRSADPSGMAQQSSTAFLLLHHQNEAVEDATAGALVVQNGSMSKAKGKKHGNPNPNDS